VPKFVADSSVSPTGLKWAVDPVADVVTTAGDLLYATAADTVTRLGIGTASQVLAVNSGATAPEWVTPAGGGSNWSLLNAGGTALTGASTVTVSGISGQNQLLVIISGGSLSLAQNRFGIQINGVTSSSYFQHNNLFSFASSYNANGYTGNTTTTTRVTLGLTGTSGAGTTVTAALNIFGGATSGLKVYSGFGMGNQSGGSGQEHYQVAGVLNTTTITSISAQSDGGNWDAGTLYIYGSA
jgi:hypothetical protein